MWQAHVVPVLPGRLLLEALLQHCLPTSKQRCQQHDTLLGKTFTLSKKTWSI